MISRAITLMGEEYRAYFVAKALAAEVTKIQINKETRDEQNANPALLVENCERINLACRKIIRC